MKNDGVWIGLGNGMVRFVNTYPPYSVETYTLGT